MIHTALTIYQVTHKNPPADYFYHAEEVLFLLGLIKSKR